MGSQTPLVESLANYFGQVLTPGCYVGKGARYGNTSRESVGTLVELVKVTESHYGTDYEVVKARVRWEIVHDYDLHYPLERTSIVHDARTLFVLDKATVHLAE